jgi:hypothetical protein
MTTTTIAQLFGTSTAFANLNATSFAQAVTISTDAVDVSAISPVPIDILITVKATFPNSTMGAQSALNIYVAASEDGSAYDDNDQYSGSNDSQTALRTPTNFKGQVSMAATQNVAKAITFSLRQLCGGILPRKFGLILENQCNQTITTKSASYTPVNYTNT